MIRTLVFRVVAVVSTFVFSVLGIAGGLLRAPHSWFDWVHRNWARSLLRAAGVRVHVEGVEHLVPGRAQILVANHQSLFDIWALMAVLPASLRFVAKAELARIPVFASAMRAAGHVFIDRGKASTAGEMIRAAGERMRRDGLTLVLFPEGTRSSDGELGRFLRGSFALAIETQAHLVPAAIDGGREVMPRGARRIEPGPMRIRMAPAVALAGKTSADRDALVRDTEATVASLLAELRARE